MGSVSPWHTRTVRPMTARALSIRTDTQYIRFALFAGFRVELTIPRSFGGAGAGLLAAPGPLAQAQETARRTLPPLKITDIKTILTQPAGDHLVIVKVLTSEPGLYGVGCATHRERPLAV